LLVPHVSIGVVILSHYEFIFWEFHGTQINPCTIGPSMLKLSKGHPSQYYSNEIELSFKVFMKKIIWVENDFCIWKLSFFNFYFFLKWFKLLSDLTIWKNDFFHCFQNYEMINVHITYQGLSRGIKEEGWRVGGGSIVWESYVVIVPKQKKTNIQIIT